MLLKNVAAKAHNSLIVTDQTNTSRPLKLLNYVQAITANKNAKLDASAVTDPEAGFENGYTLKFQLGDYYIISRIIHDYYRGVVIRANLDLILCNNNVTVSRQVPKYSAQGGVLGHIDTVIYDTLPCKIVPLSDIKDKTDDVVLNTYVILLSILNPIDINDKLQFVHTFEIAKANGVKTVSEGLIEVIFNRDTRW